MAVAAFPGTTAGVVAEEEEEEEEEEEGVPSELALSPSELSGVGVAVLGALFVVVDETGEALGEGLLLGGGPARSHNSRTVRSIFS
jgi:hypothetical protein